MMHAEELTEMPNWVNIMHNKTGRSAAWLAYLPWEQGVGGSNPPAPRLDNAPVAQVDRAADF